MDVDIDVVSHENYGWNICINTMVMVFRIVSLKVVPNSVLQGSIDLAKNKL